MSYLTLEEAAQYVQDKTGHAMGRDALLRAGVHGALLICAPFGLGKMYNATLTETVDFPTGLLVIPPSHLLEIETEGRAIIKVAHSIDGQTIFFPMRERTRNQLRVVVAELDRFLPQLVALPQARDPEAESAQHGLAPMPAPMATPANNWDEHSLRKLLDESGSMTHASLAARYGVTRQRIAALLKRAKDQIEPRRANPFDILARRTTRK